jgi:hypothetical protein
MSVETVIAFELLPSSTQVSGAAAADALAEGSGVAAPEQPVRPKVAKMATEAMGSTARRRRRLRITKSDPVLLSYAQPVCDLLATAGGQQLPEIRWQKPAES